MADGHASIEVQRHAPPVKHSRRPGECPTTRPSACMRGRARGAHSPSCSLTPPVQMFTDCARQPARTSPWVPSTRVGKSGSRQECRRINRRYTVPKREGRPAPEPNASCHLPSRRGPDLLKRPSRSEIPQKVFRNRRERVLGRSTRTRGHLRRRGFRSVPYSGGEGTELATPPGQCAIWEPPSPQPPSRTTTGSGSVRSVSRRRGSSRAGRRRPGCCP